MDPFSGRLGWFFRGLMGFSAEKYMYKSTKDEQNIIN